MFTGSSGAFSSGYNNLINWPDATNRPTLSGNVLTWIGPLNGGPSTANDVQQSVTLTTLNDVITSTHDGQIFENLFIKGNATPGTQNVVSNNNCIVRKCVIQNAGDIGRGFGTVIDFTGGTGSVIEDCIIDGQSTASPVQNSQNGIDPGAGGTITRRCNFINMENHHRGGIGMLIIDNWFHLAAGADCDFNEFDGNIPGIGKTQNVTLQHNTYDGRDTHGGGSFLNSGVNMTDFLGPVTGITLLNCRWIGTFNNVDINDDNNQGGGAVSWSIQNCGFDSTPTRIGRSTPPSPSPNSGNFIMAHINDTGGALVNGTGAIT
jgi:hypothetical protein